MKTILIAFITLAPFISHAEVLSFSGTVVEDQKNAIDLFGNDVEVGDAIKIDISIDLSTLLDGVDITSVLAGATLDVIGRGYHLTSTEGEEDGSVHNPKLVQKLICGGCYGIKHTYTIQNPMNS